MLPYCPKITLLCRLLCWERTTQRTYTTSPTPRPSGDVRARKALSMHVEY
jgi:hypothetical protein